MYWIAIGSPENWKTTIEGKKIWGLGSRHRTNWSKVNEGDILLFYATRPVQGLVGFAKIHSKTVDQTPIWSQEEGPKGAIWPFRLLLDIEFCINPEQWSTKRVALPEGVFLPRGFQKVQDDPAKRATEALQAK